MKVWRFLYCPCIHESAWGTVSLHKTKESAENALEEHKAKKLKEFRDMFEDDLEMRDCVDPLEHEDCDIDQMEVLD